MSTSTPAAAAGDKSPTAIERLLGHTDLMAAVAVVLVVTMLIIPLPPTILDFLITLNISAGLSSPASLLQGSVQFEVPHAARTAPQAPAGTSFTLYDDQPSAEQGPTGPEIPYRLN